MSMHNPFVQLYHLLFRNELPEQRAATALITETQANVDAEALALQAAVDTNSAHSSQALAAVEQQLSAAYSGLRSRVEALFAPTFSRLAAQRSQLLARTTPDRLDAVERACNLEQTRLAAQFRPLLIAARRSERGLWRALRAFRFHHRLNREARYPDSRALHFSALAFVCVVEALANTFAFAQGSSLGILGGLTQALVVAAVNVVFAFFAGRAASGLFHRNWGIKSLSAGLIGGWVAFEISFSLTVAHFRIALLGNADTAPQVALERMKTLPLAIDDVTSVLLTVFTIAFGVAALLTGLATDDRYPGFGRVTRAHREARNKLELLRKSHLGAIDAIFLPGQARLAAITTDAVGITDTYRRSVESLKHTTTVLEHMLEEVAAAYRQAVLTAREAFSSVNGQTVAAADPAPLAPGALVSQARTDIAKADETLAGFPVRLARLEVERAAAEIRLQQQHGDALEAAPAFFAATEQSAETESDHDEADVTKAALVQHALWEENADAESESRTSAEIDPIDPASPTPTRRGKGTDKAEERTH